MRSPLAPMLVALALAGACAPAAGAATFAAPVQPATIEPGCNGELARWSHRFSARLVAGRSG